VITSWDWGTAVERVAPGPRPVASVPGYTVAEDGRVFAPSLWIVAWARASGKVPYALGRVCQTRPLRPLPNDGGYLRVRVQLGTRVAWRPVHALVLEAFVGPRPSPRHHGAHLDGNRHNNHAENLAWKLPHENERDKRHHGTAPRGGHTPRLSAAKVRALRAAAASGASFSKLAKRYGIHRSSVARIVKHERRARA